MVIAMSVLSSANVQMARWIVKTSLATVSQMQLQRINIDRVELATKCYFNNLFSGNRES